MFFKHTPRKIDLKKMFHHKNKETDTVQLFIFVDQS